MTEPLPTDPEVWPVTWDAHAQAQQAAWLRATPAQRLAWLEDAIELAFRSGALPKTLPLPTHNS